MENHGLNSSGDRRRPFHFPLLASVILTAGLIAVVNEVVKGGQLARSIAIPVPLDGVPVTEHQRVPIGDDSLAHVQTARKAAEAEAQKEEQSQKQEQKPEQTSSKDKPMNIVLLYGDDWRHDSIGSAKASIVQTPFFDWMASEGMKFAHNCVTTSVCWISRATLYTGLYISRHKSDYPHNPAWYEGWDDAWPQLLKNHGYHLGHTGKWHFPIEKRIYEAFDFLRPYYGKSS
jgi:hypothetical protein